MPTPEPEQLGIFGGAMPRKKFDVGPRYRIPGRPPSWERELGLIEDPRRSQLALALPETTERPALWLDEPIPSGWKLEPLAWAALPSKRFERDYQRERVYRWERRECRQCWRRAGDFLTIAECAELVQSLTGLSNVEIKPGRKHSGRAWAQKWGNTVCLPPMMRTTAIVCHEAAHLRSCDRHGPAFMRVYSRFLDLAGLVPESEAAESARAAGIDVAPVPTPRFIPDAPAVPGP